MKPLFSENYYRKYWNEFLQRVPGENYINLEEELTNVMRQYRDYGMPVEALPIVEKMEAEKLAERCLINVKKSLETIKRVECGKSSFGRITELQEIQARAEFKKRFDFNCLQLADFRKAHGIE